MTSDSFTGESITTDKRMLVRAVRGPVLLIALGLLFLADFFGPYPFYKTWPVLLIVGGAIKLLERLAIRDNDAPPGIPFGGAL